MEKNMMNMPYAFQITIVCLQCMCVCTCVCVKHEEVFSHLVIEPGM